MSLGTPDDDAFSIRFSLRLFYHGMIILVPSLLDWHAQLELVQIWSHPPSFYGDKNRDSGCELVWVLSMWGDNLAW